MFITVIIKIIDIEIDEKPVFLLLIKNIAMAEVKYFSQVKMDHSICNCQRHMSMKIVLL